MTRANGTAGVELRIDGVTVSASEGATLLEACDAAGRYVPRLCYYPGLGCASRAPSREPGSDSGASSREPGSDSGALGREPDSDRGAECGLCVVALSDGSITLACVTRVAEGLEVITDSESLRKLRLDRLAEILAQHPAVCLGCPDEDGCSRDDCTYGHPPETRCCDQSGRCELGSLVAWLDPGRSIACRPVIAERESFVEGRIRRVPGLCVGCGRCVRACSTLTGAGDALELVPRSLEACAGFVVRPKSESLRASGCTFCGRCVLVCPAGALAACGERAAAWLAGRREQSGLPARVLPPVGRQAFCAAAVDNAPAAAGVFRLLDEEGRTLLIRGVPDLKRGLAEVLSDKTWRGASFMQFELAPMFTQRESELLARHAQEHGGLPGGNTLDNDLFCDDDLF